MPCEGVRWKGRSSNMPVLHIYLLGGLTLAWDDQPLPPISSTAARSLLAYLSTYRDRPHTRDLMAGTFWPDLADDTARRRLSQALWLIRKTLDPHQVLLTEGNTVQLHPELPVRIDVEEFLRHRAQGTTGGPEGLEHCEWCIEQYRGDLLAGYYDDWITPERERLRQAFVEALEWAVEGHKAQGSYERALTYARRLAAEEPLREEAHCEVMRLCHLLKRDREALQQYEVCRQVLAEELGAEPSASTVALADEIVAQAGEAQPPHLPVAARPSPLMLLERPDRVPLVGRQAERAELARHVELAMAGSGGLTLVVGGAGVGKTRLIQEVARDSEWRGVRVAWGYSCELSAPLPYQPLVEVLHGADLSHLSPVWLQELGRLLPELAQPPPAREPEQEKGLLLQALARAFLALGEVEPHLIVLEDVQWMDPASFEVLRILLPRLPASRLLVVATLRPEELAEQPVASHLLATLEATRIPQRLELTPLTETETAALVQRVLDLSPPAAHFSQRLYTHTAGNPFFLAETLRALVEEGLLYRDEAGSWRTPREGSTVEDAELPVPRTIARSIELRLARLAPAERDLLDVAAIIGRQVEFDLWLAASEGEEATTLAVAEELTRRGLLVEADDILGHGFAHDTIRQVVYEAMSSVRRRRWHRRVAAALQARKPDQVEALARHYQLGGDWPQAVRHALQAGERAQAVYANQQALAYYDAADNWLAQGRVPWPEHQVARWRADLAEKQGQVHSLLGHREEAEQAFGWAQEMWADLGDWRGEARVLNRWSFLCSVRDDPTGASRYANLALAALPVPGTGSEEDIEGLADLRATSLTHLGLSAWAQGHHEDALPPLEDALSLFEESGTNFHGLARCLNSLGQVHLKRGNLELASRCFARSLALRQQIGDRHGEGWCWCNQGRTALAQGDLTTARKRLEMAWAIFAETQYAYGLDTCARALSELEQAEATAQPTTRITIRLPRAGVPLGRPLHEDEWVTVTWTVAAPEDQALAGKVTRRHHRLLRLLNEARAQGAAPTQEHLAEAVGVSRRTIERDMALLRQETPYLPPTRGRMSD